MWVPLCSEGLQGCHSLARVIQWGTLQAFPKQSARTGLVLYYWSLYSGGSQEAGGDIR